MVSSPSTSYLSGRADLGFAYRQLDYIERKAAAGKVTAGCTSFRLPAAELGDGVDTTENKANSARAADR